MMTRSLTTMLRLACSLVLLLSLHNEAGAALAPSVSLLGSISDNLRAPGKLALDAAGTLYVADAKKRGIVKFDGNGVYLGIIQVSGVVRSVAVDADGRIVVSHDRQVTIFSKGGVPQGDLSGFAFQLPNGIAGDSQGRIWVTDSKANKVAAFDASGKFLFSFGVAGSAPGQLNYPTGIAYEKSSDQLAVADTLNNRIQFFDLSGSFKRSVGSQASLSGPLSFTYPQGISFDYSSGIRMFVADAFQSTVQVIDIASQPAFVTFIGNYGKGDGQLQLPSDVLFDPRTSDLLVSDSSGRITFYALDNVVASAAGSATSAGESAATGGVSGVTGTDSGAATSYGEISGTPQKQLSWQYPSGNDCSHAKAGSLVCADK